MPITTLMVASNQMQRCGVAFLPCRRPRWVGTSSSRPIAYVTRAPVLMHERVVPIMARKTGIRGQVTGAREMYVAKPYLPSDICTAVRRMIEG